MKLIITWNVSGELIFYSLSIVSRATVTVNTGDVSSLLKTLLFSLCPTFLCATMEIHVRTRYNLLRLNVLLLKAL